MDNVIFVDFKRKERVSANTLPHLIGLLMTVHNAGTLLGQDFIHEQLRTFLTIKD